jgi:hypothetical protein
VGKYALVPGKCGFVLAWEGTSVLLVEQVAALIGSGRVVKSCGSEEMTSVVVTGIVRGVLRRRGMMVSLGVIACSIGWSEDASFLEVTRRVCL